MKKLTTIANLLNKLERAIAAAKRGLGIANKLKRSDLRSKFMSALNKMRAELRFYSKSPLFHATLYGGTIVAIV